MSSPAWLRRRKKLYGQWRIYYSTTATNDGICVVYQPGKLELRRQKREANRGR